VVARESELHHDLAPGRPATKDWAAKERIIVKALEWLRDSSPSFATEVEGRRRVEQGMTAADPDDSH
jgi:hypothetical protein